MRLCMGTRIHHSYTPIRHSSSRNLLCSTHSLASHIILKPLQFSTSACILIQSWDSLIQKNRRIRKRRGGLAVVPMAASESSASSKPFGTLFVCLGNICRSPTAEAVFRDAVQKRGLTSMFKIDSAGTIDYHEGNPADPRMRNAAKKRGIEITSVSRPISPSDFKEFDLILAMDNQNKADILRAYEEWKVKYSLPNDAHKKVNLMCTYCKQCKETEVPDPYYGGPQGFEKVLDILKDACDSLLDEIVENHFKGVSLGS